MPTMRRIEWEVACILCHHKPNQSSTCPDPHSRSFHTTPWPLPSSSRSLYTHPVYPIRPIVWSPALPKLTYHHFFPNSSTMPENKNTSYGYDVRT